MQLKLLAFGASHEQYRKQAEELLEACGLADDEAIEILLQNHPRFLNSGHRSQKNVSGSEIRSAGLELGDAQLALANYYTFPTWAALTEYVEAVARKDSPLFLFESAVEAVINGDAATLESLVFANHELIRMRSTRITHYDPPAHHATLLHYVAANGVESSRQKTPKNAVEIANILLRAGAEVDALAEMYGGHYTTMSMLVSSSHPAEAGVQVALVEKLLDFGAAVEGRGSPEWRSPLMTALAFGYLGAAEALVRRGAAVGDIAAAAGLGRLKQVRELLQTAEPKLRHKALALAAQHGHVDVVRLLLDAGEDPSRYNPEGNHAHSTPLHQAVLAGHEAVVRLLVERGARLDIKDKIYEGTPLGWAQYGRQIKIEQYLRARGAKTSEELGL